MISSPRFCVGCEVKPINSFGEPQTFKSIVIPTFNFEYHLARRAMDSDILGIFSCAAACSGGIDATGTLRPDFASVWNFDPGNGSLDLGGGALI